MRTLAPGADSQSAASRLIGTLTRLVALMLLTMTVRAQSRVEECKTLQHHGKTKETQSCFVRLTRNPDPFLRAEGYFGLNNYDEANTAFRAADKSQPRSVQVKTEWGRLFFEHYQPQDAELCARLLRARPGLRRALR